MHVIRPHRVVESKKSGVQALQLTEHPYGGIIFSFGKVDFEEKDTGGEKALCIKFDYEVHDDAGLDYNKEEFERYLGDFLQELIWYGLENNDLVYTGGVDENRTEDSNESTSQ